MEDEDEDGVYWRGGTAILAILTTMVILPLPF